MATFPALVYSRAMRAMGEALTVLALLVHALAGLASAVSPVPKTFAQLVSEAELIVVGTVTRVDGVRLPEGLIVSDVALTVLRVAKATEPTPPTVVLRVLGGQVGDAALQVPGAPQFRPGETYLLFVRGNLREIFPFVGVQQGVFSVRRDAALGVERVFDWQGHPVIGLDGGAVTGAAGVPETAALPLDDVLRAVAQVLRG